MTRSPARLVWYWFWMMAPLLLLSGLAYANVAPAWRPPPRPEAPFLKIERIPGLERARLVVPKKLLAGGNAAKEKADAGISPTQTAVAGVAMSGAIGLLGLQLVRRRAGKPATLLLIGGIGMSLLSAAALADIAIPNRPNDRRGPPEPPIALPEGVPVTIEVVEQGNQIVLQVAPEHLMEGPGILEPPPPRTPRPPGQPTEPGSTPPGEARPPTTPPSDPPPTGAAPRTTPPGE